MKLLTLFAVAFAAGTIGFAATAHAAPLRARDKMEITSLFPRETQAPAKVGEQKSEAKTKRIGRRQAAQSARQTRSERRE